MKWALMPNSSYILKYLAEKCFSKLGNKAWKHLCEIIFKEERTVLIILVVTYV
jgi:hypothetical protein